VLLGAVRAGLFGLILGGCGCVALRDAQSRDAALERQNRERTVPAMQRAAAGLNAVLLEGNFTSGRTPRPCPTAAAGPTLTFDENAPTSDVECIEPADPTGRLYRIITHQSEKRLFVTVTAPYAEYARLALRGRTLYVLTPDVTRRKIDDGEKCACDGMPHPVEKRITGFPVAALDQYEVVDVKVPVTFDYVEWQCRAYAL
jgi:hypothetical protein